MIVQRTIFAFALLGASRSLALAPHRPPTEIALRRFVSVSRVRMQAFRKTSSSDTTDTNKLAQIQTGPSWLRHTRPATDQQLPTKLSKTVSRRRFNKNNQEEPIGKQASKRINTESIIAGAAAIFATTIIGIAYANGVHFDDAVAATQNVLAHPQESLQAVLDSVEAMGSAGPFYFGLIYLIAEILAVPATPLTLSAGYLFGMVQGFSIVLVSATIAASVAFFIGKTFLRTWVEETLETQPKFKKIDKAIGKEGFKLLLLVRLSPVFPFAISNYLYGASSINFSAYFWGTILGFAPGTLACVYTGMVGKALTLGEGSQPWYVYAGGFVLLATFLKLVSDVASDIVEAIDDDE
jgi:uncharacterized membrane protein YdjX (TVP38/TMEM64 family)